jgi:uncharacterized protein (TIGR02453 family)
MFSDDTLNFLKELASNNNREWFDSNRPRYEKLVREPALDYIRSMESPITGISPYFIINAKKTGGSLMRIFRDLRFSKDKTPYKTNIGIQFRHTAGKDVHAPGFYLHIEPGEMFLAAGIWSPDTTTLNKVRTLIDEHPDKWKEIKSNLIKSGFEFHGVSLKNAPKGFASDHILLEDLKRKHYVAVKKINEKILIGKSATRNTAALFEKTAPLLKFICKANGLGF